MMALGQAVNEGSDLDADLERVMERLLVGRVS